MKASEIFAELTKLNADERSEVFERLCRLHDEDLIRGSGPSDVEKRLLDDALASFERDGDMGTPWREACFQLSRGVTS